MKSVEVEQQFTEPGFYFQWHFLEECNLRCRHCYQEGYSALGADLTLIDKTISQIDKALSTWDLSGRISLTGGEPFLDVNTLYYILDNINDIEKVHHVGILTNGTLLSTEIVERLKKFPKLMEVQISLDGATAPIHDLTRGYGNFEKAIAGIKLLVKNNIPTAIMFTASKVNFRESMSIVDLAAKLGVSAITVERYTPAYGAVDDKIALTSLETQEIYTLVMEKKKLYNSTHPSLKIRTSRPLWSLIDDRFGGICPVGFSCLTIMHDGIVFPCRRLPISLGSIQNDGLFKIWYTSSTLWKLREKNTINVCGQCVKNKLCGGCRAAAYASTGNFMEKDPLCWKE